jgi:hypothetical protein
VYRQQYTRNTAFGASQSTELGAIIKLKLSPPALVGLLILSMMFAAAFSSAQDSPPPRTSDTGQSAEPPAPNPGQTPSAAKPPAGQPAATGDQTQKQSQGGEDKGKADQTPATSKDRLFFALPNFLTVDANGKIVPLTAGQKFKVVARGSFDPVQIVWYGALSGISQAENSEPGFGQGAEGYGKRYGAYAADGTIENFFVGAILPSVLHQDPRFFPKPEGGFFSRTEYAVTRIVVTRGDSGHRQFNFSEIFGSAIASTISTYSYHPRADRNIGNTASVWASQVGYDTITIVVKEFWPDIRRKLKK